MEMRQSLVRGIAHAHAQGRYCARHRVEMGAYGKAGIRNETETGNGNWKQKCKQKMHQPLVQYFCHSVLSDYSSILLSNRYGTNFMSRALPLLLYCSLVPRPPPSFPSLAVR